MSNKDGAAAGSALDIIKWMLVIALLTGGIVANYYFGGQPFVVRLGVGALLCLVVALVAAQTAHGHKLWGFARDSRMEMRKVTWPTRQETMQSTLMVIAMVVVMALILWAFDAILIHVMAWLTGQR